MHGMHKDFWLRWRFDFHDKPSKIGGWLNDSQEPSMMAAYVNKEGLSRAAIEAKNLHTKEVITAVECDGWDFFNFQWVAVAVPVKSGPAPRHIIGMKLLTRTKATTFYIDGSRTECLFDYVKASQPTWQKT